MALGAHNQQRAVTHWKRKRLPPLLPEDWSLAQTIRANVLLIGRHSATNPIVNVLLRTFREPVTTWHPGERLLLPPVAQPGTIILHDVGALGRDDQHRLLDWLEQAAGRTRVISTTSAPLLPLIEQGAFNDTLYYRLNTFCIARA